MSIRTVQCPACGANANILATMTDVRCAACGVVWNTNNPQETKRTITPAERQAQERKEEENDKAVMASVLAGAAALLVLAGLILLFVMSDGKKDDPQEAQRNQPQSSSAGESTNTDQASDAGDTSSARTDEYKVVDLPLSTRKKLYREYKQLTGSTTDKSLPLPKDSGVRGAVEGMLGQIVDRELDRLSLVYNITKDEIMEVIKEGNAKNW